MLLTRFGLEIWEVSLDPPQTVTLLYVLSQPSQVQHSVNTLKDVIVGDKVAQRAGNKQVLMPAVLVANQGRAPFSGIQIFRR